MVLYGKWNTHKNYYSFWSFPIKIGNAHFPDHYYLHLIPDSVSVIDWVEIKLIKPVNMTTITLVGENLSLLSQTTITLNGTCPTAEF